VIEFDIPPGAEKFTLTRTYEASQLPDPLDSLGFPFPSDLRDPAKVRDKHHRGRATLTLNVRRSEAAAAPASAPGTQAAPATPAATPVQVDSPQKNEPARPAQPSATDEAVDTVRKLRGLFGR